MLLMMLMLMLIDYLEVVDGLGDRWASLGEL